MTEQILAALQKAGRSAVDDLLSGSKLDAAGLSLQTWLNSNGLTLREAEQWSETDTDERCTAVDIVVEKGGEEITRIPAE